MIADSGGSAQRICHTLQLRKLRLGTIAYDRHKTHPQRIMGYGRIVAAT